MTAKNKRRGNDLERRVVQKAEEHGLEAKREEWRPIPSVPGYSASSFGRIRRDYTSWNNGEGGVLSEVIGSDGYNVFTSRVTGRKKQHKVHRCVCEAFHLNPDDKPLALHKDDNKRNNASGNLYWGTVKDNHWDAKVNGKTAKGEKNGRAVLTYEKVKLIRRLCCDGVNKAAIARHFGIGRTTLGHVLARRTWKPNEQEQAQRHRS